MSINCTERTLSLFMALLMITTAFIPVVSAMGTTNNYTFTKHGTVESEWNWAQPVSWMNYTSSSFDYDPVMVERYDIGTEPIFTYSTPQMVSGVATLGSEWNWSVDGWDGWSHTAYRTLTFRPGMRPISSCTEYGPVIVGDHGEYGADFHLYGDAMRASVEHEFIDPSGVGWNSLTLVGRVPGTNHPWGRWMTIEVNNQIVYSESGFSSSDPENLIPKEFHADFPQSDNVRVKISHGQEQAWNARFFMEFYSLKFSSNITPDANFTANPLSGPAPLEVQFNDTSSGTPTAWAWDFNNDGIIDSTEQNPGYTYTEPGLYTVSLTAGNACGENSTTKNDYTNVTVPSIEIHSPIDDRVASGDITVAGNVYDSAITGLTLIHNGVQSTIPVQNGNFSAVVTLTAANNITISGIDSQGNPLSTTLLLDGDMLPAAFEEEIGFDPLNSDSNCTQTAEDESGNGVIDGYEIFDGKLPVFAKYRIGADPFTADTDGNGLTDYFELVKLGVIPGESSQPPLAWIMSDSGDGPASVSSGTGDDPDEDGLSNLEEQTYGTDPLSADTDRDNLQDAYEIQIGTDPLKADSDDDGLTDECELKLGTDPLNADSNGNGIPDGNEDYLSQDSFIDDTLELAVLGQGYAIGNVSVAEVNFTHLISDEVLVSKVYDIGFGPNVRSGELKIKYDSTSVSSGDNLSIYRFDTEIGTFMPVQSVVDASNEIVSCNATNSSKYAVLNSVKWDALFEDPLVETDTVQAAGLAEPADTLSEEEYLDEEHYIKAVDERYPLKTALEVELVEGVDYGVIPYNETPEWNESEIRLETEEPENADLGGYEDPMATSSDEVRYQAVSNGDFFNGMADWSPGSRVYHEGAGSGHEIDTYNLDYSSAPRCLRISLWNNGHTKSHHNYEVAHANVDLTGVDTLTFKYNCLFFQKGTGLTTSRLEFKIDGTRMFRFPEYQHIPYAYETNGWLSQSIDVGGYTGMHNISFNGYLTYGYGTSSSNELSKVQFLIDDVSAWSIQQPAEPDTANIRFFVRDSQTNEGVGSASVSCNNEQKRTDSSGYTNDFFLKSKGTYEYRVEASGYKTHEGLIKVTTLGESKTVYAIINKESAPTGNIRVTSDPNPASIYVDGVFGGSTNDWVYDLLAGSHTVEVRKEGYYPASRTVQVSDGGTTNVAFQLTSEAGTVEVTSSPPGATVYIDDLNKGTTSESSGTLTISEVPVGERQVRVIKEGYVPYLAIVTVEKDQTVYVDAALNNDDLEEDGLLDYYEVNGFRDGFGNHHTTDPDLVDTDGDGLSDGYEAGEMVTENGKTFFRQRSDPTKADTDGDGLDDYLEDAIESDPFNADTDGDGLSDSMEWNTVGTDLWSADSDGDGHSDYEEHLDPDYDPLVYEERYGSIEMGREFLLGGVLGEWGVDDHDNTFYLGGWIASGLVVIGDVRDIAATISRGDLIGTGLNLAALIPAYGDAAKISAVVGKFVVKHPELLKPAMVLMAGVAPHVDEAAEAVNAIRKAHGDEVIERLLKNGITENELKVVYNQRGNLAKTLEVIKRGDGKVFWLEKGKLGTAKGTVLGTVKDIGGSGWIHLKNNHVVYKDVNNFADVFGEVYRDGSRIKELIMDGAKYGQKVNNDGVYHYVEPNSGKILLLVIGNNGYIVTAYPLKVK